MEEKTVILEMVEKGKISVDEAVKLLNAVNNTKSSAKSDFDENLNKVSNSIESFAKDVKKKLKSLSKDDNAKLKENAQTICRKTGDLIEEFSKSVKDLFKQENSTASNQENSNTTPQQNTEFNEPNFEHKNTSDSNNINNN